MFSVDHNIQDIWLDGDAQGTSILFNETRQTQSGLEDFTSRTVTSEQTPSSYGKGPIKTPGVLRTGDAQFLRDGQPSLPAERSFAIQIGWRLFRLSGASIMSDGKLKWIKLKVGLGTC
jgi:hypothetical protein